MTRLAEENSFKAVQLLDQAVARDPAFLLAHCQLAYAHDLIYFFGFDHTETRLALAETSVRAAVRLRPDSGETHLAQAIHFYWGYRNYDRAREELAKAERTLPNNAQIFLFLGLIDRRQGRWDEAVRNLEHAVSLDPRHVEMIMHWGQLTGLRRYEEALAMYNRALALEPRSIYFGSGERNRARCGGGHGAFTRRDKHDRSRRPIFSSRSGRNSFRLALRERDPAAAARALANIPNKDNLENYFPARLV